MKILSGKEVSLVSGAGSNSMPTGNQPSNSNGYNNANVVNCNNGIIGGMLTGAFGGVAGLAVGLVGGAIAGGCFTSGSGSSSKCGTSNTGSCSR